MAVNPAWAFVRPMEIIKGGYAEVKAQNDAEANAIAVAAARDALQYNRETRPLTIQANQLALQTASDNAAFTQALRPFTLQSAEDQLLANQGAQDFTKVTRPFELNRLQNQQTAQTQQATTSADLFAENQAKTAANVALKVPQTPGESELSIYQKMVAAVAGIQDPRTKAFATQQLNSQVPQLALQAANRGDSTSAQDILYYHNKSVPAFLASMPPVKQIPYLTNTQVTSGIPDAKAVNEMRLHQTPTGNTVLTETMKQADRNSPPTMAQLTTAYSTYLIESQRSGMTPMPFTQYANQFNQQKPVVNSVTGPAGVPYPTTK